MESTHSSDCELAAAAWSPWGTFLRAVLLSGWGLTVASAGSSPPPDVELCDGEDSVLFSSAPSGGSAVISSSWTAGGTHRLSSRFCSSLSCCSLSWSATFSNSLKVWRWKNRSAKIKAWTSLIQVLTRRGKINYLISKKSGWDLISVAQNLTREERQSEDSVTSKFSCSTCWQLTLT